MAVVRPATLDDLEDILDIATLFNDKYVGEPLNPDKARTSLRHFIEEGVVLCATNGAIVGMSYEDPFRDQTILLEIGWYAEGQGKTGLALLRQFIRRGRELGVDKITLSTLAESDPRVGELLMRMGFTLCERSYTLTL